MSTIRPCSVAVSIPELSVVIPAYREAQRLPASLERIAAFVDQADWAVEVLVVDDGSDDGTASCAAAAGVRVVRHEVNRGKGAAARTGMLAARGSFRLLTDADLSAPIDQVYRLLVGLAAGFDVAIGSRTVAGARLAARQPRWRQLAGRAFGLAARTLFLPGIGDTQCGFKLFTATAAVTAFTPARTSGFAFDVEVLANARRAGCRIVEVPLTWRNDTDSRVSLHAGLRAFLDLGHLWLRQRRPVRADPSRSALEQTRERPAGGQRTYPASRLRAGR